MKIENLANISRPYRKGELTEVITDHEFINEDKDWFHEQIFLDENAKVVAKFIQKGSEEYDGHAEQLSPFRKDIFAVHYRKDKERYDIVQVINNEHIVLRSYDDIELGEEDCTFRVRQDNLIGFIDVDGNEIIKPQYINANEFNNGITVAKNTEYKYGLINKKNEILIPFMYDDSDVCGMLDGYCVFSNINNETHRNYSYIYNKNYELVKEYDGEVYNLGHGNFAIETEYESYEIIKIKNKKGENLL